MTLIYQNLEEKTKMINLGTQEIKCSSDKLIGFDILKKVI